MSSWFLIVTFSVLNTVGVNGYNMDDFFLDACIDAVILFWNN
jgi:hypothetical protein